MTTEALGWFEGFGIELEYMLVDRETLDVRPIADVILQEIAGEPAMEVTCGDVCWSNELALHVIELKTHGPKASLDGVCHSFTQAVIDMNARLAVHNACLMPSGMHPWMDPEREFRLWPADEEQIYATFDRIFDCRGHGWSNLQSMHINLPFKDDAELHHLHAAIRFLLPLLPALSASTPFVGGRAAPNLDERLTTYRFNAKRVPSVAGHVVPEAIASHAEYQSTILKPVYEAMAPLDPEGVLRHEWVNGRGCIARFDRNALEIRVLDAQECPQADLATAYLVTELLDVEARTSHFVSADREFSSERLASILWDTVRDGGAATVSDTDFLRVWRISDGAPVSVRDIWRELSTRIPQARRGDLFQQAEFTIEHGCLARRLRDAIEVPDRATLHATYKSLCDGLPLNRRFSPEKRG